MGGAEVGVGGGLQTTPPPVGGTVDAIMAGRTIKAVPKGGQKCAHALGRLLVDTFDEYAAKLQEDGMSETDARAKALEVYTAAVTGFENRDDNSSRATFLEFMVNLAVQVAADPDVDPDHVAAVFERGILPIVGFCMLPLGVALIALDLPWTRHKVHDWVVKLKAPADSAASTSQSPATRNQ